VQFRCVSKIAKSDY